MAKKYYAYCAKAAEENNVSLENVQNYCKAQGFTLTNVIADDKDNKVHWDKRALYPFLDKTIQKDDWLLVYEASDLARSTLQLLEILEVLSDKGATLYLIKYDQTFTPETFVETDGFLRLIQNIEGDFVTKRTTDALARRRAAGLPLGRPKGRKNKTRKLDKHKAEIRKYLSLNVSKASIAKLVGCHAQTLYNYLEDKNLLAETEEE